MKIWFPLLLVALGLTTACLKAEESRSLLEREPEGWVNLLSDFSDWERVPYSPKRPLVEKSPWKLDPATGILDCDAAGIHELLLYRKPQKDGVIHVEWRYVGELPKPNSGLFFRTSDDALTWLQAHMSTAGLGSLAGTIHQEGGDKKIRAGEKRPELQRSDNEWNVMEVTCKGSEVTLWINGQTVAVMKDCPILEGKLGLEAEFNPVQFRNFQFKPSVD